jgi:YesN/AraC family two-component response regulator
LGHEVVGEAANGLEAYDRYGILKPDLVTMDVTMPKMEGVEAVKKIIGTYPNARIIMISAQSQKSTVYDAIKAGALTFLAKPLKSEVVVKVLYHFFPEEIPLDKKKAIQFKNIFFKINLKNDQFTVPISNDPDGHPITSLHKALSGLLFIAPLNVLFNYEKVEKMPKEIMEMVVTNFKRVKEVGGTANIISKAPQDEKNDE